MAVEVADLKLLTSMHPSQWEGRLADGRPIFIHYKWGELRVCVGRAGESVDDAVGSPAWFHDEVGEKMGCMISLAEVAAATGLHFPPDVLSDARISNA